MDGLHTLVVEDDLIIGNTTATLLRHDDHRVELVTDGSSASQAALNNPPDVVLLDLGLPGMVGWGVAGSLQAQTWHKRPFFIALTGGGGDADHR
jgi:DNA-binding response OmpR family regulator